MVLNYFKVAWRELNKRRSITLINLIGLSLGLTCCLIIFTVIKHDFSFDKFHEGHDRIYRLSGVRIEATGDVVGEPTLPPAAIRSLKSEIDAIEKSVGFFRMKSIVTVPGSAESKFETDDNSLIITDTSYFGLFKYKWLAGSPRSFNAPYKAVLTLKSAERYFGKISPNQLLGKEITYDSLEVTIVGILEDWQENSDLNCTDFISLSSVNASSLRNKFALDAWLTPTTGATSFILVKNGVSGEQLANELSRFAASHPMAEQSVKYQIQAQPLASIHFTSDGNRGTGFAHTDSDNFRKAHKPTLYGLALAALLVLLIAIFNFVNLATAQASYRSKEVGVRKVLGSNRQSLIIQFFTETFILSFCAMLLAVVLVSPGLQIFSSFIPSGVAFTLSDLDTLLFIASVLALTTLLAGAYPAFVLSSAAPIKNFQGSTLISEGRWSVRRMLVVLQFTVSIAFIVCGLIVQRQIKFSQKDSQTPLADILFVWCGQNAKVNFIVENFRKIQGVEATSAQMLSPIGFARMVQTMRINDKELAVSLKSGGSDLKDVLNLELYAGRNLQDVDSTREFLINERFAKEIDFDEPENALGQIVYYNEKDYLIVGIVKDFHEGSFHEPIGPMAIANMPIKLSCLARISPDHDKSLFTKMEAVWHRAYPDVPFEYTLLSEDVKKFYEGDQKTAFLIHAITILMIVISCMGIVGLMLFVVNTKAKEISVRKVMGASFYSIVVLLSNEITVLYIFSLFCASPISWYFMQEWLNGFAYHINIGWWEFIAAGLGMLSIALVCTVSLIIQASRLNPAIVLKRE